MSNFAYRAAVFDLDGTLVQSEHLHRESWIEPLARRGMTLDDVTYFRDFAGKPGMQIIRDHIGLIDAEAESLYHDVNSRYWEIAGDAVQPTAGLVPFLESLDGLPKAVCTSAQRESALRMLDLLGLAKFFDAVITATDVDRGKPDPEPFLLAATRLNVEPDTCVAFEDSANGLISARAAAMATIGIGPGQGLYADLADVWIADFTDPALEHLMVKT
jgi:HAD superfamily hydrolase (TIGR01509 family)